MGQHHPIRSLWVVWRPFIYYGVLVSVFCIFIIYKNYASTQWPTAEGRVRVYEQDADAQGSPVGGKAPVTVFVQYEYEVNGEQYRSTRLSYITANDEQSTYNPTEYNVGEKVEVYYNPHNHAEAFLIPLDPHDSFWMYFILIFHLGLVVTGGISVFFKKIEGRS